MATWKQVILKDPITGEYLAPMGGNFSGGDADTLQSHPASDFLLKSEYTPVDLSEYLKTATADTKYAAVDHNHSGVYAPVSHTHTTGQISDLSTVLAGYAPASHTHTTANITGLDTKLSGYDSEIANLKSSVSEGKSLIAAAVTDKGVQTAADATFQTIANNIAAITSKNNYVVVGSTSPFNDSITAVSTGPDQSYIQFPTKVKGLSLVDLFSMRRSGSYTDVLYKSGSGYRWDRFDGGSGGNCNWSYDKDLCRFILSSEDWAPFLRCIAIFK